MGMRGKDVDIMMQLLPSIATLFFDIIQSLLYGRLVSSNFISIHFGCADYWWLLSEIQIIQYP